MGVFVLVPTWYALVFIRQVADNGQMLLLFLMLAIWAADSGAYFAGRMWGNKKILPLVSPGKTWVGFLGGLLLSLSFASWWLVSVHLLPLEILKILAVVAVTVVFSVLGDFFESMLKREAGLKDSGTIFPGHGGLLDRIDSLTAAAPVFLLGLLLINIKI